MKRASPSEKDQKLLKILQEMESLQAQYPEELLSARRASFLEQVAQAAPVPEEQQQTSPQDRQVIDHLRDLGSAPVEYPPRLLAARRSTYVRRIAWINFVSSVASLWLAIQKRIPIPATPRSRRTLGALSTSLLAASLVLAAFVGYFFFQNQKTLFSSLQPQYGTVQSGQIITTSARAVRVICKPGAQPPLCLAGEYKTDDGLAYQGNGSARPAVAKDTMPGTGELYKAAYLNDGMYGPGASWISNSTNSWIKIDLGKATEINTVTFGRDRLGKLTGHNPGQFFVSLALTDNVYANGNNSNDNKEYETVFNSKQAGFSGVISGAETVVAQFAPREARYIKLTFENKGTAIDEVQAFLKQPPLASSLPRTPAKDKDKNKGTDSPSAGSSALQATSPSFPILTATSWPVDTATMLPTNTSMPDDTVTPAPTATEVPSNTPVPTSTVVPTSTSVLADTDTPIPSDTPLPPPTSTPVPPDTATSAPPEPVLPTDAAPTLSSSDYLVGIP
jgi:hypothetical protein